MIFFFDIFFDIFFLLFLDRMASQKEQFHEAGEIFRPESMIFGVPEPQLLKQYSVVQVNNFQPYEKPDTREPSRYGVFDPALGAYERDRGECPTCGKDGN